MSEVSGSGEFPWGSGLGWVDRKRTDRLRCVCDEDWYRDLGRVWLWLRLVGAVWCCCRIVACCSLLSVFFFFLSLLCVRVSVVYVVLSCL